MKIGLITDVPLLPAIAGNRVRILSLIEALREFGHEVSLLGLGYTSEQAELVEAECRCNFRSVPRRRARDAQPLSYGINRFLRDRLVTRGITQPGLDFWYWPHWDEEVRKFAQSERFDAVIVEYVFLSRALLHFDQSVLKIIDTHDVFTNRSELLRQRGGKTIRSFFRYLTREEEARGLSRADVVVAIQAHEAAFFRELLPPNKSVVTVGHRVDLDPVVPTAGAANVLFLGSDNALNVDGISWFLNVCWPQIRQAHPHARLLMAGGICKKVRGTGGVDHLGQVDDVKDAYRQAAVVINPIRVGTGLKIKSLEALGYARPLVTTSVGADGLRRDGKPFVVADSANDFANEVVRLLQDNQVAEHLAARGFAFAQRWNADQSDNLAGLFYNSRAEAA